MDSLKLLAAWESNRRTEQARRAQILCDLRWVQDRFAEPNNHRDEESYDDEAYGELCQWVGVTLRQLGNVSLATRWDWVHTAIAGAMVNITGLRGRWDRIDPASLTDAELDRLLMERTTLTTAFDTYDNVLGEVNAYLNLGGRLLRRQPPDDRTPRW